MEVGCGSEIFGPVVISWYNTSEGAGLASFDSGDVGGEWEIVLLA